MIRKLEQWLKSVFDRKTSAIGLGIFRIAYCIVLLGEICRLFYFRHLIYDKVPYLIPGEVNFGFPLVMWGISVVFVLVGYKTRAAALVNYVLTVACVGTLLTYEYHMFYSYLGLNFMFLFLPVSRCLSVDRIVLATQLMRAGGTFDPAYDRVSRLYYQLPLFFGIAVIYLDSILFKITSHNWMSGLGMWLPASLPMISHLDSTWLMNIKWLVIGLGYITVAFEALFPFLFWFKRFRIPLLIIGVGLHFGIVVEFPIPLFGIGIVILYSLLVPQRFWGFLSRPFSKILSHRRILIPEAGSTSASFASLLRATDVFGRIAWVAEKSNKEENVLSLDVAQDRVTAIRMFPISFLIFRFNTWINKTDLATIKPLESIYSPHSVRTDRFKILVLSGLVVFASCLQIMVSYSSGIIYNTRESFELDETLPGNILRKASGTTTSLSVPLLGISNHAVFMDAHFKGYNHIIAVSYVDEAGHETWLPIIDKSGMPDTYLYGFNWVKWTFRVVGSNIDQERLRKGIRDFTAFWAYKHKVDLAGAKFKILVKKVRIPKEWEKDFLQSQMDNPWMVAGEAAWSGTQFQLDIVDIESL